MWADSLHTPHKYILTKEVHKMAGDVNDNRVPKDRDKLVDSKYKRKEIGFLQKTTRTEIDRKERTRDAQSPGSSFG